MQIASAGYFLHVAADWPCDYRNRILGFGQWLRKRGYGEKLDNIDHKVTKSPTLHSKSTCPFSGFCRDKGGLK